MSSSDQEPITIRGSKSLKLLNFLDRRIRLIKHKQTYEGEVYYFNNQTIILKINLSTYEVINLENFEDVVIEFVGES